MYFYTKNMFLLFSFALPELGNIFRLYICYNGRGKSQSVQMPIWNENFNEKWAISWCILHSSFFYIFSIFFLLYLLMILVNLMAHYIEKRLFGESLIWYIERKVMLKESFIKHYTFFGYNTRLNIKLIINSNLSLQNT